jgi:hypothetical protein
MNDRFAGWFIATLLSLLVSIPPMAGLAAAPNAPDAPISDLPLKISDNGRYLVDQKGNPFLVVGDSPWSLIVQLDDRDRETYADNLSRPRVRPLPTALCGVYTPLGPPARKRATGC